MDAHYRESEKSGNPFFDIFYQPPIISTNRAKQPRFVEK
ncbi:hypothetical protein PRJH_2806 [Providencia rustigianii]